MVCVLPGRPETLASFCRWVNILINELFPTFERPIKAYSGLSGAGHLVKSVLLVRNSASLICISLFFLVIIFVLRNDRPGFNFLFQNFRISQIKQFGLHSGFHINHFGS